jgi:hypothetical protein
MGKIKSYPPVKIFTAITYQLDLLIERIQAELEKILSPIDSMSNTYLFEKFTTYYRTEMGSNLHKKIISFQELQSADRLPDIKIATNHIEKEYQKDQKRTVNIDPGYICAAKVILATTKDYDHRIYLKQGIFGDVHLRFRQGQYQINEWTYPDYRQREILEYFESLRRLYLKQLQNWHSEQI